LRDGSGHGPEESTAALLVGPHDHTPGTFCTGAHELGDGVVVQILAAGHVQRGGNAHAMARSRALQQLEAALVVAPGVARMHNAHVAPAQVGQHLQDARHDVLQRGFHLK